MRKALFSLAITSSLLILFVPSLVLGLPPPPHAPYVPPEIPPPRPGLPLPPREPYTPPVSGPVPLPLTPTVPGEEPTEPGAEPSPTTRTPSPPTPGAETAELESPISFTTIPELINSIINWIFWIGLVLAPLMIVIGGFLFMTAGGDLEKIKKAKALILWSTVGLGVLLLSKGIAALITAVLTG